MISVTSLVIMVVHGAGIREFNRDRVSSSDSESDTGRESTKIYKVLLNVKWVVQQQHF